MERECERTRDDDSDGDQRHHRQYPSVVQPNSGHPSIIFAVVLVPCRHIFPLLHATTVLCELTVDISIHRSP